MTNLSRRLKSFESRVRIVRSWRGLAMGLSVGAGVCAVWALLDLKGVLYTEWSWMGILAGSSAVLGALVGFLLPVPSAALVASIDRRANLDDRLTTAQERQAESDVFDEALRADADARVSALTPQKVYPIKVGRWQGGALALSAVAAAIFLLGNTPIALSAEQRLVRKELQTQGQAVERVTKESFETPEAKEQMSDAEKRLADELRRYQRDLEKSRMSREEAMQKGNELQQKADELAQQAQADTEKSLEQAQSVRQDMEKDALKKAGMGEMNPSMAQMSDGQRQQMKDQLAKDANDLQKKLQDIQKQLDEINKKLSDPNLSQEERKKLEEEKKALEEQKAKALKDLQKNQSQQKQLELSEEARKVFQKLMQNPLYKQLLDIEKKLAEKMQKAGQKGDQQPPLSDEERKEIQKQLEELAKQLKDDKAMQEYLQKLIEAAKHANQLCQCRKAGIGLGGLPMNAGEGSESKQGGSSMQMPPPAGPGAPTEDTWEGNNHILHKMDHGGVQDKGKTTETSITGSSRPGSGPQAYVEIKAPSGVGDRSSVPYTSVLPSYKQKAESALDRQQIPKQHQKRVKEYFDSLTGTPKN